MNVSEAPGGKQGADAFTNLVAVQRLTLFLGQELQEGLAVAFRYTRELNRLHAASGIGCHGGKCRRGQGGLLVLILERTGRRVWPGCGGRAKRQSNEDDEWRAASQQKMSLGPALRFDEAPTTRVVWLHERINTTCWLLRTGAPVDRESSPL